MQQHAARTLERGQPTTAFCSTARIWHFRKQQCTTTAQQLPEVQCTRAAATPCTLAAPDPSKDFAVYNVTVLFKLTQTNGPCGSDGQAAYQQRFGPSFLAGRCSKRSMLQQLPAYVLFVGPCRLIEALIEESRKSGCYKVILDCSEANQAFYEKCGLTRKEVQMVSTRAAGGGGVNCQWQQKLL